MIKQLLLVCGLLGLLASNAAEARFVSVDPAQANANANANANNGKNFNRYHYANNNPYKFIDPDGRYSCTNSGATCSTAESGRMEGYVQTMRDAQANMQPGDAANRVGQIADAIGTAWDNNGVTLNFSTLKEGTVGEQNGTTLNIDENQIKGFAAESGQRTDAMAGSVIGHEGSHLIDSQQPGFKGNAYPTSRTERLGTEIRAYGVNAAIDNVLGIRSGVNAPGMSIKDRSSSILNAAQGSVESACADGGYGCR